SERRETPCSTRSWSAGGDPTRRSSSFDRRGSPTSGSKSRSTSRTPAPPTIRASCCPSADRTAPARRRRDPAPAAPPATDDGTNGSPRSSKPRFTPPSTRSSAKTSWGRFEPPQRNPRGSPEEPQRFPRGSGERGRGLGGELGGFRWRRAYADALRLQRLLLA